MVATVNGSLIKAVCTVVVSRRCTITVTSQMRPLSEHNIPLASKIEPRSKAFVRLYCNITDSFELKFHSLVFTNLNKQFCNSWMIRPIPPFFIGYIVELRRRIYSFSVVMGLLYMTW